MALFKDVKKPVIKKVASGDAVSALRPRFAEKQPPCAEKCPAGSDIRSWLSELAAVTGQGSGRDEAYAKAWRIIVETNPFPSTLGRICPHPCEGSCHRSTKDGAVAINVVEGFVGDLALARGLTLSRVSTEVRADRVAIVGAGPAGLSCAYQLVRRGNRVVVFEGRDRAGGRLRDAVRTGRLQASTVDAEIARIQDLGVEIRLSTPVDDRTVDELSREYRAVYVAVGRPHDGSLPALEASREVETPWRATGGQKTMVPSVGEDGNQGGVAAAIARGRLAAVAIDRWFTGRQPGSAPPHPTIGVERLKLGWYKPVPRHDWKAVPQVAAGAAEWQALEVEVASEAARCLSCGMCIDCDNCWMYCTSNGFERLPKGQHYRIKLEMCNGCKKCGEECPTGYIDLV